MKRILYSPLFVLLACFLVFCSTERTVFEEYTKFDDLSWNRFDLLEFEAEIEDVSVTFDFFLHVRHIPEIPYKEMTINYSITMPSGDMRTTDLTFDLKNEERENLAECLGDLCDIRVLMRKDFMVYDPGKLKIELENKFTKIEMPGIIEIGIIIKESREE